MAKRLKPVAVVLLMMTLTACDTEASLEPTPEAVPGCDDLTPSQEASGAWGEAQGIENEGVQVITVNEGYTVTICAGGGNQRYDGSFSEPGLLDVGPNFNGWSVVGFTGPTTTTGATTTTLAATTTTAAPDTSTSTDGATTLTEGGVSTTSVPGGATTTTTAGATTTTATGEVTTTVEVGGSTLAPGEETTTTVTGEVTTTDEVGAGTLEPGQEATTTTSETGATDPGEETTTTDEVGGGSESTLPYTGVGDMTMGGLAGIVLASGLVLLLLVRRRSSED